jgi:hypothetical protein
MIAALEAAATVGGLFWLAASLLTIAWLMWEMRRPCNRPAVEPDEDWLDDQPHEVDTEALMNAEFVSIISANWHWTEDAA